MTTTPATSCAIGSITRSDYGTPVYETLSSGITTVIHVGPGPNVIPATFNRLSENVTQQMTGRSLGHMGMRAAAGLARRPWLSTMLAQPGRVAACAAACGTSFSKIGCWKIRRCDRRRWRMIVHPRRERGVYPAVRDNRRLAFIQSGELYRTRHRSAFFQWQPVTRRFAAIANSRYGGAKAGLFQVTLASSSAWMLASSRYSCRVGFDQSKLARFG